MSPALVRLSLDALPLPGMWVRDLKGAAWGAARAHLSLLTCSTPQGAAAEMGICPRCCRTQGGM